METAVVILGVSVVALVAMAGLLVLALWKTSESVRARDAKLIDDLADRVICHTEEGMTLIRERGLSVARPKVAKVSTWERDDARGDTFVAETPPDIGGVGDSGG